MKKKKIAITLSVIIALGACGGGTYLYLGQKGTVGKKTAAVQETAFTVKKGNIRSTISGTAQLEAHDLQMIVPPKEAQIKTINLQRNMTVKKGDLLLELSDSDLEAKLDQERLTLSTYQSDMSDLQAQQASLRMVVPTSGKLILGSNISEGSGVSKTTKVATIADTSRLTVTLPFRQEEAVQFHAGDTVELTIDGFMLTKVGTVESVSQSPKSDAKGNRLSDVIVRVDNDGTMDADINVKGTVAVNGQKAESVAQAPLQYKTTVNVYAGVSGTINKLDIKENRAVTKGELIGTIVNDTLQKDITQKQQQIDKENKTIKDLEEQLEKLKVYAPFDGIFSTDFADTKKNILTTYTVGTTIGSNVQLGGVASTDTLQLPIKVDELDLPKIKVGQKADVKVDAVTGKTFSGEVTQVSTVGTTANGVSTYTVVVSLKNTSELKYGMTATADVIIQDRRDVLTLPVESMQTRAGKTVVTVKKADGTTEPNHEIKTGANNSTMVEVTEGLKEGDQVVLSRGGGASKLSQSEAEKLRQQFQQSGRTNNTSNNNRGGGGGGGFGGPPPGF